MFTSRLFSGLSQFLRSVSTLLSDYATGKLDKTNLGNFSVVRLSLWLARLLEQATASITDVSGEWEALLTVLNKALNASLTHRASAEVWAAQTPLAASCLDILASIRASEEVDGPILVPVELLETLRIFLDPKTPGQLHKDIPPPSNLSRSNAEAQDTTPYAIA